jgi:hypothetical protein
MPLLSDGSFHSRRWPTSSRILHHPGFISSTVGALRLDSGPHAASSVL